MLIWLLLSFAVKDTNLKANHNYLLNYVWSMALLKILI